MRIISGKYKGAIIQAPGNLPVRPTTDRAKESLFNILANYINFENINVLDLFSGTGNIAYEFASRGTTNIFCVDKDARCVNFIKRMSVKYGFGLQVVKADVFSFIKQCRQQFDIIFADAPYHLQTVTTLPGLIQQYQLLKPDGMLIIEHASILNFSSISGCFETRKYGQSSFSFFKFQTL